MDDERRDELRQELRDRNRRRAYNCSRCGSSARTVDGSELSPDSHFAGIKYKVCGACGHEEAKASRRPKRRSLP